MKQSLKSAWGRVVEFYNLIVALEQMPMRRILGDFYEEKEKNPKGAPRQTKTKVEDLRPKQ